MLRGRRDWGIDGGGREMGEWRDKGRGEKRNGDWAEEDVEDGYKIQVKIKTHYKVK